MCLGPTPGKHHPALDWIYFVSQIRKRNACPETLHFRSCGVFCHDSFYRLTITVTLVGCEILWTKVPVGFLDLWHVAPTFGSFYNDLHIYMKSCRHHMVWPHHA